MNDTTSHSDFSIYFLPSAFVTLNLITCLCSFVAAIYGTSQYYSSWNILFDFPHNYKNQFIYIIRLVFFYRKSTIDFSKTNYTLQLFQANDTMVTLRIPAKFFEQNQHNTFTPENGTIKFLLIRDTELQLITKIGITHDHHGGELNFSLVDIQDSTKSEGYLACFEKSIKPLSLKEVKRKQCCMVTPQLKMELEGEFTVIQAITAVEFICPLYMYLNIISSTCTDSLIAYFQDFGRKHSYDIFHSLQQAIYIGLGYFFFIFGLTSILFVVSKHVLEGKPRRYGLLFHVYAFVFTIIGFIFGLRTVSKLDPDLIQFVLKDANFLRHFMILWIKMCIFCLGIAVFYGFPFTLIYFTLISILFKQYK